MESTIVYWGYIIMGYKLERERERESDIYIYMHINIYIYIESASEYRPVFLSENKCFYTFL